MMCFRDRAFCSTTCGNGECDRNFTAEQKRQATIWGGENAPVSFHSLKDTASCLGYKEPIE